MQTPIGYQPKPEDLNVDGLSIDERTLENLLDVDIDIWKKETEEIREFYKKFGDRLPKELHNQLEQLEQRLNR